MATGKEFMSQLETRFAQLNVEERLDKILECQRRLTALKEAGLTEEEAVALLEQEFPLPMPMAEVTEDYGNIHHPKKPLLTAVLYTLALAAVLAAAAFFTRLMA